MILNIVKNNVYKYYKKSIDFMYNNMNQMNF